jgi:hypothetical protein
MRGIARVTDALRDRKKAVIIGGAAAALLGAGSASVATVVTAPPAAAHVAAAASAASAATTAARHGTAAEVRHLGTRAGARVEVDSAVRSASPHSWAHAQAVVASQAGSTQSAAAEQLQPVGTSGPQSWMPISDAQMANATAIVKQALDMRMGVRSAVIAVATSMQESTLNNINYGTSDSLGLFQQQPSCGWGSAEQIMQPSYAARAFLGALQHYQASNPEWAHQPLWQSAQGVQASAFPLAYAKWEAQAAQLVKTIMTQVQ